MTLSEYIIQNRTRMGWSQRELSRKCGISNQTISILEKGINPSTGKPITPDIATLYAIASAFGTSLHAMMGEVDDIYVDLGSTVQAETRPLHPEVMALFDSRLNGKEYDKKELESELESQEEDLYNLLVIFRGLSPEGRTYLLQQADIARQLYGGNK